MLRARHTSNKRRNWRGGSIKLNKQELTVAHVWVGDRAHGTGKLGTDAGDTAEVLTDGFSA